MAAASHFATFFAGGSCCFFKIGATLFAVMIGSVVSFSFGVVGRSAVVDGALVPVDLAAEKNECRFVFCLGNVFLDRLLEAGVDPAARFLLLSVVDMTQLVCTRLWVELPKKIVSVTQRYVRSDHGTCCCCN